MADVTEKPAEKEVIETAKEAESAGAESVEAAEKTSVASETPQTKSEEDVTSTDDSINALEHKIIRQVEYYFGDANLGRDKFLLEQTSKDEGWVPLTVLLTFKRLSGLSTEPEVIVNALAKSDEGLLEISEDRTKIRRHPERPVPEHNEERRKEIMTRTAYAKGFPLDTDIADLLTFFAPYEKVLNVNMRKYLDKPTKTYKFKGSVFVTFEKKEQAQEFIEKEKVVFKERELIRKWQDKYLEEKSEERKQKSKKAKKQAEEENKIQLPKGTVLFFTGAPAEVTRELLREAVEKIEGDYEIAYIDYSKGNNDGHLRFQEENIAAKFLEKLTENKLKLEGDIELTLRTLTEEEEKVFLDKAVEHMKNRRNHLNKHKGGNRKRRSGNHNRNDEKKKRETADA